MKLEALLALVLSLKFLQLECVKVQDRIKTRNKLTRSLAAPSQTLPELYYTQVLDHSSENASQTWKQRYFVNDKFFSGSGPVFLYISGENPLDPVWLSNGRWAGYAKRYKALYIGLEHRFYGKSHPTSDASVANLKYLTSQQALADIVAFQGFIQAEFNLTSANLWISFGGSYAGALSAWLREKYPDNFYAAYASSAPIQAELDFYQYLEVVNAALEVVSPTCVLNVNASVEQMKELATTAAGLDTLKKKFGMCNTLSGSNDIEVFFSSIANDIKGVVQYNNQGKAITVQVFCDAMNNTKYGADPLTRYAYFDKLVNGAGCGDFSYSAFLKYYKRSSWVDGGIQNGARQWMWQACNEFGFMQTTNSMNEPYYQTLPLDFETSQCQDIFGISPSSISTSVTNTNKYYGGAWNYTGTRVIFANGELDPWHTLSVLRPPNSECYLIHIDGAAHCADLYAMRSTDPPSMKSAQARIQSILDSWLLAS